MVIRKRRKLKAREFIEEQSLLRFIQFLVFHIVLTLVIIEVVIRSEEVAAELTNTIQAAVSLSLILCLFPLYCGLETVLDRKNLCCFKNSAALEILR